MSARLPPEQGSGVGAWLTRVAAGIGAAVAIIASFFLGFLVFLTALGLLLLLAVGVAIRVWWLRRQFRSAMRDGDGDGNDGGNDGTGGGGGTIEGEYVIIRRGRSRDADRDRER